MQALNKYDFKVKVYFCMGIFNLLLAIPFAKEYGGIDCAFATDLTMFIGNELIMNWYYAKVTGLDIKSFWLQIGKISLGVCSLMIVGVFFFSIFLYDSILLFLLKIMLYTVQYCYVMYDFCMNADKKNRINKLIMRFLYGIL